MLRRLLAVFMCAGLFLAAPALAGDVEANDPNDQKGMLDLAHVRFAGDKDMMAYTKIEFHDAVSCSYLKKGSGNKVKWLFDDGMDGDIDLVGVFQCSSGKLMFFLKGKKTGNNYEAVRARRPNQKTIKVSFPLGLVELKSNRLGVFVKAKDVTDPACKPTACIDRAPSSGSLRAY